MSIISKDGLLKKPPYRNTHRITIWGASLLFFRPLLEHLVHVHGSLLQHLVPDVSVDVGSVLIVGMPDNLHCDQRIDTAFVEQGDIVVPEIVWRDDGFDPPGFKGIIA